MKLKLQKKIAARVLKCGVHRVWIDPTKLKEVKEAITASDIRKLIEKGIIKKLPVKGVSRGRKRKRMKQKKRGRRRGPGSRKGTRVSKKRKWIKQVRALRRLLRELKAKGKIDNRVYRDLYMKVKGGMFRSKAHLKLYITKNKLWRGQREEAEAKSEKAEEKPEEKVKGKSEEKAKTKKGKAKNEASNMGETKSDRAQSDKSGTKQTDNSSSSETKGDE